MGDLRIDRRAFLELVACGVPSLVALGAGFQITSFGWTGTRYSLTMIANAEGAQGGVAPAAAHIIDTHAHLQARGPHHPQSDFGGAAAKAREAMDREGISRTIIMPPPFGPDSRGKYDCEDFAGAIGEGTSRFAYLGVEEPSIRCFTKPLGAGTVAAEPERNF